RFDEPNRSPGLVSSKALAGDLKLDRKTLEKGSAIFRKQCLHCHGLPGDGRGPTGPWVNPHPRDFRQGFFKFASTDPAIGKPRREDIRRTLLNGIDGTSMPSFHLLPADDLENLISYVIHLSIRGEAERSEEHTSELQSQSNLVCRLLLEKKNNAMLPHRA